MVSNTTLSVQSSQAATARTRIAAAGMARAARTLSLSFAAALTILLAAHASSADPVCDPPPFSLLPFAAPARFVEPDHYEPGSTVAGKTIAEWSFDFWRLYWSVPARALPERENIIEDVTGAHQHEGQTGPVWFLNMAGGIGLQQPTTRNFVMPVPADTYLLVSLLNFVYARTLDEDPCDLPPISDSFIACVDSLFLIVDGEEFSEETLFTHVELGFFDMDIDPDNFGGEPGGFFTDNHAAGFFVMLPPLSTGMHTIEGGGTCSLGNISLDLTNIYPVPEPSPASLQVTALGTVVGLLAIRRRRTAVLGIRAKEPQT